MRKYYGTKNFVCWLHHHDNNYFVGFGETHNLKMRIDENYSPDDFIASVDANFKVDAAFTPRGNTLFHEIVVNSPEEFDTICKVLEVIYG